MNPRTPPPASPPAMPARSGAGAEPRAPRWERRKQSRPTELLEAALSCFVERGYAATRLEDVASQAGVSKGTLYLYFSSKDELFKAVVRGNLVPLIEAYRHDLEQSELSGRELLQRFFEGWWLRVGATRLAGIAKLILGEAGNFPDVAEFFVSEVTAPTWALLGTILRRGIAAGEFRAVDVEAACVIWMSPLILRAVWMHAIAPNCEASHALSDDRFLQTHLDLVLAALRPDGQCP